MTTARVRGWGALLLMVLAASGAWGEIHPEVRLKDLADVEGVRGNQLVGMGLVVGLAGTGDKGTLVNQMMQNMAQQFGIAADAKSIKSKNAAVVTVTCNLPPFVRPGQTVDVEVSTMGEFCSRHPLRAPTVRSMPWPRALCWWEDTRRRGRELRSLKIPPPWGVCLGGAS